MQQHVLLSGVVGSTAYGLATEDSDVDRLGIFATPTIEFLGLDQPKDTFVTSEPDSTLHEAGKFCRLALKANPTVGELLWLSEYETTSRPGTDLLAIRTAFLSAPAVRKAYLGYAREQLDKLRRRGDGSFSADIPARRARKHARHLVRITEQGEQLYTTGNLTVRLSDPDRVRELGNRIVDEPDYGQDLITITERRMETFGSPLPAEPDRAAVESWLRFVRHYYYHC